jgi:anti-sigma factor RsiW
MTDQTLAAGPADAIGSDDLQAFVDGQLDAGRAAAVSAWLARHPEAARNVFADLHNRHALRAAFQALPHRPSPATRAAARRLTAALWLREVRHYGVRAAAVVALVALGWFAHWQAGAFDVAEHDDAPAFVVDAVHAYRVSLQRAQAKTDSVEEVFARGQVAMPRLKNGWRLADALIYPSHGGDGVGATLTAGDAGELSLFAVHTSRPQAIAPTIARNQDQTTIYWQRGSTFYALTGQRPEKVLRSVADTLMKG